LARFFAVLVVTLAVLLAVVAAAVLGAAVNEVVDGAVVVFVAETGVAVAAGEEFRLPEVGVVVVVGAAAGRVVIGVGTGGKGFDITLAIISFRPASD
jgi:hypothetical protein